MAGTEFQVSVREATETVAAGAMALDVFVGSCKR